MRFLHRSISVIFRRCWVGLRLQYGRAGDKVRLPTFGNDHRRIYTCCRQTLDVTWQGDGAPKTMDSINQRYGEFMLSPARLLRRSDMPNAIALAWKPDGHRQTI